MKDQIINILRRAYEFGNGYHSQDDARVSFDQWMDMANIRSELDLLIPEVEIIRFETPAGMDKKTVYEFKLNAENRAKMAGINIPMITDLMDKPAETPPFHAQRIKTH